MRQELTLTPNRVYHLDLKDGREWDVAFMGGSQVIYEREYYYPHHVSNSTFPPKLFVSRIARDYFLCDENTLSPIYRGDEPLVISCYKITKKMRKDPRALESLSKLRDVDLKGVQI